MYVNEKTGVIIIDHLNLINPKIYSDKQKQRIDKITEYMPKLRNKNNTKNETN